MDSLVWFTGEVDMQIIKMRMLNYNGYGTGTGLSEYYCHTDVPDVAIITPKAWNEYTWEGHESGGKWCEAELVAHEDTDCEGFGSPRHYVTEPEPRIVEED